MTRARQELLSVVPLACLVVEIYNNGPVTNEDGDDIDLDTAVDFLNSALEVHPA